MNLTQFSNRIQDLVKRVHNPDEITVGVKVHRGGAVGGTSIAEVTSVQKGFDWDNHKFIIYTVEELRETNRDEITALNKELSNIGWTAYEFSSLKRENARLRKELAKLKGEE